MLTRIRSYLQPAWTAVKPDEISWQGATYGLALVTLALIVAFTSGMAVGDWAIPGFIGMTVMLTLLALLSGSLSDPVMAVLNGMSQRYRWVLIGSVVILAMAIIGTNNLFGTAVLTAAVILPASLLGAGIWSLARGGWQAQPPVRRGVALTSLLVGAGGLTAALLWYSWPGPAVPSTINAAWQNVGQIAPIAAADPAQPGPHPVLTLAYGSGQDRRRAEFGTGAALITPSVDGSPFIGNWQGISGNLRSRYWGFDATSLPLNGRVWYPDGDGPFPLALIVHGNHDMMNDSDPGYDYLGQLLASRGVILVSVDQNFLNGGYTDVEMFGIEGLQEENDGRGWLLLEHLTQWQAWSETADNPFYGKVDMARIVLMGHSRGGEAAAIAAAFNRLPVYPDDARVTLDYNFNIRGVVAIAPSDGQYEPAGRGTSLTDVNYLAIQGAYDGDVIPFQGARQYNRVQFSGEGDWFKAAVYVNEANHGQFNSRWGRSDRGGFPARGLLNLASIMPEADQQRIAQVYISAFVEATLRDNSAYLPLFRDARVGRNWLPETVYLSRYQDSRTLIVADYEEDVDLTTASLDGGAFRGDHLTLWYERVVPLKHDDQQSSAVYLGWDSPAMGQPAAYRLNLEASAIRPSSTHSLIFSLADGNMNPNPHRLGERVERPVDDGVNGRQPLDLTIELLDAAGNAARLPLSHFSTLQPQLEFFTRKTGLLESRDARPGEIIFQSYEFRLADFQAANPAFDPGQLVEIRFVFDRSERGVVVLDEIGFRP